MVCSFYNFGSSKMNWLYLKNPLQYFAMFSPYKKQKVLCGGKNLYYYHLVFNSFMYTFFINIYIYFEYMQELRVILIMLCLRQQMPITHSGAFVKKSNCFFKWKGSRQLHRKTLHKGVFCAQIILNTLLFVECGTDGIEPQWHLWLEGKMEKIPLT